MTSETVQIAGAPLLLLAYLLAQVGVWSPSSYRYLVPNLLASSVLTVDAVYEAQVAVCAARGRVAW